jgi:uncharacterized membrane protein YuzA (DUF378 family)
LDRFALIVIIIGAIIWGVVGIFGLDPVTWLLHGSTAILSKVLFTLIGIEGIWCIKLLFLDREEAASNHQE